GLKYIETFKPERGEVQHIRIMLYGQVGSGKSSLINSLESALRGRITVYYPFVFTDLMGLENQAGVRVDDIRLALQGHVREEYQFDPDNRLSNEDEFYNSSPMLDDITHVLVCVVPANTLNLMADDFIKKMRKVRLAASELGIPQMAVLTKIDEACPEVKSDIKKVYLSKIIKDKVNKTSTSLGIQPNFIFPVKNYHTEVELNSDMDKLILTALKQMLHLGDDFVNMKRLRDWFKPDEPWRKASSDDKDAYLQYISEFKREREEVQHIRTMLYGPVGSGKSSFINTVESALRGRMTGQALSDGIGHDSFTTKFKTHRVKKERGVYYPFVFTDLMGLERRYGVSVDDIKLTLQGHVTEGYKVQRSLSTDNPSYNSSPTLNDKTHVLVCVVLATTMAVLTKIDEACLEVSSDIKKVYRSKIIKDKVSRLSGSLGIQPNFIFPVKNYHTEVELNNDIDTLILTALKQILHFGEDFLDSQFQ
ncbi:hypothetical protein WMY93_033078, partial [Mugilogobius chulae]